MVGRLLLIHCIVRSKDGPATAVATAAGVGSSTAVAPAEDMAACWRDKKNTKSSAKRISPRTGPAQLSEMPRCVVSGSPLLRVAFNGASLLIVLRIVVDNPPDLRDFVRRIDGRPYRPTATVFPKSGCAANRRGPESPGGCRDCRHGLLSSRARAPTGSAGLRWRRGPVRFFMAFAAECVKLTHASQRRGCRRNGENTAR